MAALAAVIVAGVLLRTDTDASLIEDGVSAARLESCVELNEAGSLRLGALGGIL